MNDHEPIEQKTELEPERETSQAPEAKQPTEVADGHNPADERLAELGAELLARTESEQALLMRLRRTLIESDPLVDPELVQGATIAELEESFARARSIAERLEGIVLQQGVTRVPAGAPGRAKRPFLSSFEKIREGLKARG